MLLNKHGVGKPLQVNINKIDYDLVEEFIHSIKILMKVLGYGILEPLGEKCRKHVGQAPSSQISPTEEPTQEESEREVPLFEIKRDGFGATGRPVDRGFVVYAGSSMRPDEVDSCRSGCRELRRQLVDENIVVDGRFQQDYYFAYSSLAASVIFGANRNGFTEWRTSSDPRVKNLGEWLGLSEDKRQSEDQK